MKRISLLICFALILSLVSCSCSSVEAVMKNEGKRLLYLVCGFDEAAENTDVIFTVSYDPDENTARIAQIPRDTFYNSGMAQNKLNQIYASLKAEGMSDFDALSALSKRIASAFNVSFDGFFGITVPTFRRIVDSVGGLEIELNEDVTIQIDGEEPFHLEAGKNYIRGEEAVKFVRYRKGYATGDLGRMDAQKIFLNALFGKLSGGIGIREMVRVANEFQREVITDASLMDLVPTAVSALRSDKEKRACYVTVPGEASISSNGLSFYVLNRKSAAEIAKIYMNGSGVFDAEELFCNKLEVGFVNIYYDEGIIYREYTNENISDMHIP